MNFKLLFYTSATIFIFILLLLYFIHPINNLVGDLGFYLKTGEIISHTGAIPDTNLFSYTNPLFPFINPNWLAEVCFYLVQNSFGFNGLIVLAALTIVCAFGIIFFYSAKTYHYFATLLVSLLGINILFERTEVKPELFSYIFFSLFIVILYKNKQKATKWIYALIPLMIFWVNFHIYFFVGILTITLFLIDKLLIDRNKLHSSANKTFFLVYLGVYLATFCNPHGFIGAFYPFSVLNNYAFPVEENSSFSAAIAYYTDTTFPLFILMIITLWIGILFSIKRMAIVDILLSLAFTILSFSAIRTFPLFIIGAFIPFVKSTMYLLEPLYKHIAKEKSIFYESCIYGICIILLFPTIQLNLTIHGLGFGVQDSADEAIQFMQTNSIKGPLYNNYDIGNYLIYKLYPEEKVFVDGRPEAYPKSFFESTYFPLQNSSKDFETVSNKYHFNALIIKHTDTSQTNITHIQNLIKDKNWKLVFLNNSVLIFLRTSEQNRQIIDRYSITENTLILNPHDVDQKDKIRQLVNLFHALDWEKPWLQVNKKYLEYEPNNCSALQNMAYIYQKNQSPEAPFYVNKFIQTCNK